METSKEQASTKYADFEEKVKKTIYIDQLSPQVTTPVIKAALAQCANVVNVEFIVNYTIPYDIPSAALVELDDEVQAKAAVELMTDFPFIIGGMPRPVKATYAKAEMFRDRPPCPGLKKDFRWIKQGDGEYETMKKLKNLAKKQESENMALIKLPAYLPLLNCGGYNLEGSMEVLHLERTRGEGRSMENLLDEEKELAKQQQEALDGNGKKYDMLEAVVSNGTIRKLAHHYGVSLDD
ncbi:hypothetical protein C2845_PM10G04200 [Panicum miliaceum]|uniref:RRM domain-containing protein n=1 Tax=Panicum miliaceum TaxID=4540 RepID=A0A3L6PGF2_PANMI|nr:hypothetical protein C2845_PM10G04200 [Panicum miliaceum]